MTISTDTIANNVEPTPRAPVAILREEAEWFNSTTDGQVVGEITQVENFDTDGKRFYWTLKLRSPALGNYRYRLLSVEYGINFYPLTLNVDEDAMEEILESENFQLAELVQNPVWGSVLGAKIKRAIRVRPDFFEVESQEQLLLILRLIFNTKRVAKVINAIRAQIAA